MLLKRKTLITASIFLFGVIILAPYYFLYFKKGVIYDLVNIEFSGISFEENTAIKYYGVTPVDKKILLHKDIDENNIPGCFKYIEIVVPDTLISKITSIRTTLKRKVYTYKISELHSPVLSGNTHTYILPTEVKSEGPLSDKISASYPFTILLQALTILLRTRNADLLIMFFSMFCIIFFTFFIWRFTTKISQKKNFKKSTVFLQSKKIHCLLISFAFLFLLLYPFLWPDQIKIEYFLLIFLFISFALQSILNIRKSYLLYLVKVILITFICFEIIFGIMNRKDLTVFKNESTNFYMEDSMIGFRIKPNCKNERYTKIQGNDTIYDVAYSTDKYGRRAPDRSFLNDLQIVKDRDKKHAVFLGCSFTFGAGLIYNSTFPFLFENMHPDYNSYNYGVSGYGPHEFCFLFDDGINIINNEAVQEDSGFCLYSYIDDHLYRVYGSSQTLSLGEYTPDVYIENNKAVIKKHSFFKKLFNWILNNSETLFYFKIATTYPKTETFYKRFANLINYISMKYWNMKPCGKFYVALHPGRHNQDLSWIKYLNKKIIILDIPPPKDFETGSSYLIENDGHPTKKLNLYYVEEISKLMFKNK